MLMKQRAKAKRLSLNAYVTELIEADLRNASVLPPVVLPAVLDEDILGLEGSMPVPDAAELANDERLSRIWER